jgi:hypothetical protein
MAKTIEYKVKIVNEGGEIVEKTAKSFKDLQASQASLSAELQKTDLGSKKFKELQSELKATNGAVNDAKNKTTPLLERLGEMPGIVGTAAKSVSGLGTSMKALIANPIGAVIAAISAVFIGLYKAINSTEEGAFKFKEVLAALSGVLDPVIKLAGQLGSILVDGILAGVNGIQKALKFLGFDVIEKASKDAQNLAKSINQVEEAEGDLNVERAQQNKALAEAREIISDTNKSLKERQSALAKVKKSEEDLAAKETALANKKLKNIREEIRLKGKSTELLDAEEQALISLANTEQNQAAIRRKNLKAEQALVKEDEGKKKEAVEKYKTLEKERADARKASNELIKGYTLNGIKDEQEKALLGVKYAKDAQYQQINDLKVSLVEKNKLKKLADEEAGRQEKEIREKYAKEAADFEEQQTLKLIKSDDERAKKTLELANQKEIERINALKVSEEKRTELLLNQQQIFQAELDKLNLSADEKERLRKLKEIDTLIEIEALKEAKTEEQRLLQNENLKKFLKSKMDLELSALNLTTDERALIEAKYAKQIEAIDKGITDTKVSNSEKQTQAEIARLGAAADTLGSLSELLGKDTEAGKAAAVAQATINTYKGITEIIAAKSVLPEPAASIAKGIQIAAVLATGLKSVSTIKGVNTSVPPTKAAQGGLITGVGSGTLDNIPVMVSNGESIINANSTRMFSPLLSAINEMGGGKRFGVGGVAGVDTQTSSALSLSSSISGLLDKPIKTYVVSSEVSSTQALDRQIKNRSTI